jgi:hypothetical protein
MVIDNHWRVAAVLVLRDETLGRVMHARLEVHGCLWTHPSESTNGFQGNPLYLPSWRDRHNAPSSTAGLPYPQLLT